MKDKYTTTALFLVGAENTRPKWAHLFSDANHIVREVKDEWKGRRVRFYATGGAAGVIFGVDANVEADLTAVSGGTPPEWDSAENAPTPIAQDNYEEFFVEHRYTHFSVEASNGVRVVAIVTDLVDAVPSVLANIRPSSGG